MKLFTSFATAQRWTSHFGSGALALAAFLTTPSAMAASPLLQTVVVQARSMEAVFTLDGVIQPVKQSTVAAQASGRIASLLVRAGDKVHAGQLLATIDDRESAAGLQRSQAQVSQADAELRNARSQLERTRDLQRQGFVSKAALDTAEAQHSGTVAMRDQATAAARQSAISQSFSRVTAPFDGWVLLTLADMGDLAVPGKPLLTVYAPQPMRAVVQVPASRAQAVRDATRTLVQVNDANSTSATNGAAQGIVPVARTAMPSADPVSQTTEWRLELPTRETSSLLPGQQVRVQFAQPQSSPVSRLVVPLTAVVRRGELTAVYVAAGNAFALRAVRLGSHQGPDGIEVLSGIAAGETVALDGVRAGFANAAPASQAK